MFARIVAIVAVLLWLGVTGSAATPSALDAKWDLSFATVVGETLHDAADSADGPTADDASAEEPAVPLTVGTVVALLTGNRPASNAATRLPRLYLEVPHRPPCPAPVAACALA